MRVRTQRQEDDGQGPPDEAQREREEGRPDPEELLQAATVCATATWLRFLLPARTSAGKGEAAPQTRLEGYPHKRGRLRVYLASAAGAGKTYAMLDKGHRRESRGYRCRGGLCRNTPAYSDPAQIGDLEIIPRKQVTYRGRDTGGDGYRGHHRSSSQSGADR